MVADLKKKLIFLTFQTYSSDSDILLNHKVISFHTKDEIA